MVNCLYHACIVVYFCTLSTNKIIIKMPSTNTSDIIRASDSTYFVDIARVKKFILTYLLNVAAARTWNGLPEDVTSSPTLPAFRTRLNTHLFRQSYPDIAP